MSKNAGIQTSFENPPNQLAEKVVPVMETNPELLRTLDYFQFKEDTGTGGTMATTPTDRDVYLTGCTLSIQKDVTSTLTAYSLRGVVNGIAVHLADMAFLTLTIANQNMAVSFPKPIKLDRNSTITITLTGGGVATHKATTTINGYQVLNNSA